MTAAPVLEEDLLTMLDALIQLHGRAYKWNSMLDTRKLVQDLGSQPVRTYVRAAMEALDLQYVYNEAASLAAVTLTEQALEEDRGFWDQTAVEDKEE